MGDAAGRDRFVSDALRYFEITVHGTTSRCRQALVAAATCCAPLERATLHQWPFGDRHCSSAREPRDVRRTFGRVFHDCHENQGTARNGVRFTYRRLICGAAGDELDVRRQSVSPWPRPRLGSECTLFCAEIWRVDSGRCFVFLNGVTTPLAQSPHAASASRKTGSGSVADSLRSNK